MSVYRPSTVKRSRSTNAELDSIDAAIIAAVNADHPVSLRGVYYRVVSAGAIPKTDAGYRLIGRQLVKLRKAGQVPYPWITDGTRLLRKPQSWDRLEEMLSDAAASYRRALWNDQDAEVIVLSEKEAISGAIYPVTARWDVELAITRGYSSETFTHSIADTVSWNTTAGKTTFLYQLGDHDPSGVDAWRAFEQRIREFAPGADAVFQRLAVTPEQILDLGLPTRPTKTKDTRARGFVGESVEVDAIPAATLRSLLEDAIVQHLDPEAYRLTMSVEDSERAILTEMIGSVR